MESNADLRRQLQDAIANVRQQIDVQERTPSYGAAFGPSSKAEAIEELQVELAQLEEALRSLSGA